MTKSKKQQAGTEKTISSPNSGEITWGEIKQRAAKEANELAQAIRSKPQQFCQYVIGAFNTAAYYAKASRVSPENRDINSGQFLSTYLRLVENLKRADKLLQTSPKLLDKWPQTPNAVLGHIAGWSALVVVYKFSQRVENAVTISRVFTLGVGFGKNFFDAIVPSDERVRTWLDAAITKLQTRTLPPLADWPMWKVRRDVESLYYQLLAERKKSTVVNAVQQAKPQKKRQRPPLPDNAMAVLALLENLPERKGLTGKQILQALDEKKIYIDQSTLTKGIIPRLRHNGYRVKNKRNGAGYYIGK